MANTKSEMVKVECGKCGGKGTFYFHFYGRTEACFPCKGTGSIRMTAKKFEQLKAAAARYEAQREERFAEETAEQAAYDAASALIATKGIAGAREFFAANRTNRIALGGLILAMRDARMEDASNAVVAHRNAL